MNKGKDFVMKRAIKYQNAARDAYALSQIYRKMGNSSGFETYFKRSTDFHKKASQYLKLLLDHK